MPKLEYNFISLHPKNQKFTPQKYIIFIIKLL